MNPALSWTTVNNAQSYAIVVNHTNSTGNYTHWAVKNIPATTLSLKENSIGGGVVLKNSFNNQGYSGPETLDVTQTYKFYIYAVKVTSLVATELTGFYSELENDKVGYGNINAVYANTKS